mgnify:CR=1 FL=1
MARVLFKEKRNNVFITYEVRHVCYDKLGNITSVFYLHYKHGANHSFKEFSKDEAYKIQHYLANRAVNNVGYNIIFLPLQ